MLIRFLLSIGIIFLASCTSIKDESTRSQPRETNIKKVSTRLQKGETAIKEETTVPKESGLTFAIQNSNGDHLGFLLMVGSTSGDCIFRSLPATANNLDTPATKHLFALQNQGGFSWEMQQDKTITIFDQSGNQVAWVNGTELKTDKFQLTVVDASKAKAKG